MRTPLWSNVLAQRFGHKRVSLAASVLGVDDQDRRLADNGAVALFPQSARSP